MKAIQTLVDKELDAPKEPDFHTIKDYSRVGTGPVGRKTCGTIAERVHQDGNEWHYRRYRMTCSDPWCSHAVCRKAWLRETVGGIIERLKTWENQPGNLPRECASIRATLFPTDPDAAMENSERWIKACIAGLKPSRFGGAATLCMTSCPSSPNAQGVHLHLTGWADDVPDPGSCAELRLAPLEPTAPEAPDSRAVWIWNVVQAAWIRVQSDCSRGEDPETMPPSAPRLQSRRGRAVRWIGRMSYRKVNRNSGVPGPKASRKAQKKETACPQCGRQVPSGEWWRFVWVGEPDGRPFGKVDPVQIRVLGPPGFSD